MGDLLDWYEPRRQAYPWRVSPTPFGVLVSEVMLQQTQVARVVPAWERFMEAYPSPPALASAPLADVLRAWAGLGYNRRAVALHRAAAVMVASHRGAVPSEVGSLRQLPGVGAYTAAAVASCAYGVAVAAVDVNIRRVVARARLGVEPTEVALSAVAEEAQGWLGRRGAQDPGAWNQALMDVGREHCRAVPRCDGCPLHRSCRLPWVGSRPAPGGSGTRRRPEPFAGSSRQLRGRIVQALREATSLAAGELAQRCGEAPGRMSAAIDALAAEGLVTVEPGGQVRLGGDGRPPNASLSGR